MKKQVSDEMFQVLLSELHSKFGRVPVLKELHCYSKERYGSSLSNTRAVELRKRYLLENNIESVDRMKFYKKSGKSVSGLKGEQLLVPSISGVTKVEYLRAELSNLDSVKLFNEELIEKKQCENSEISVQISHLKVVLDYEQRIAELEQQLEQQKKREGDDELMAAQLQAEIDQQLEVEQEAQIWEQLSYARQQEQNREDFDTEYEVVEYVPIQREERVSLNDLELEQLLLLKAILLDKCSELEQKVLSGTNPRGPRWKALYDFVDDVCSVLDIKRSEDNVSG